MADLNFEYEVYAPTRPPLNLLKLNTPNETICNEVERILSSVYVLISVDNVSSLEANSVSVQSEIEGSNMRLGVLSWLNEMLTECRPASIIIVNNCSTFSDYEILKISLTQLPYPLVIFTQGPREELLTLLYSVNRAEYIVITSVSECSTELRKSNIGAKVERYYQDILRRLVKKKQNEERQLSIYSLLFINFRIAFINLFLNEPTQTLKIFHNTYLEVVQYYQSTMDSGGKRVFFENVRWTCDVITFKIMWLLLSSGEKSDAEYYLNGHLGWFTPSFSDPVNLITWKCRLYSSFARILSYVPLAFDPHHSAYFQLVTAKNLLSLPSPVSEVYWKDIFDLLASAYEFYRGKEKNRMTIAIGKLLAINFIKSGNPEQAIVSLSRLRKSLQGEGWNILISDILEQLLSLTVSNQNNLLSEANNGAEWAWEYANNSTSQLSDLEEHIRAISNIFPSQILIINAAEISHNQILSCSARFSTPKLTVNIDTLKVDILLCNMSSLVIQLKNLIIRFSDHDHPDLILNAEEVEIVPGSIYNIYGSFIPQKYGLLAFESISINLIDLPIQFIFPANTLTTEINIEPNITSWSGLCHNHLYLQKVNSLFSSESLITEILPITPLIIVTVTPTSPFILGYSCFISISLENTVGFDVDCTIYLSTEHSDVSVKMENGNQVPLDGYSFCTSCPASMITVCTMEVCIPESIKEVNITLNHRSSFTAESMDIASYFLSPNTQSNVVYFDIQPISPFIIQTITDMSLTEAAYELPECPQPISLFIYSLKVAALNNINSDVCLVDCCVEINGWKGRIWPEIKMENSNIESKNTRDVQFIISAEKLHDFPLINLPIKPIIKLIWKFPSRDQLYSYCHTSEELHLFPRTLYVVPTPLPSLHVGKKTRLRWLVFNQTCDTMDILLKVEETEGVVYMGVKQEIVKIPSYCCHQLIATMIPLKARIDFTPPRLVIKPAYDMQTVIYDEFRTLPYLVKP